MTTCLCRRLSAVALCLALVACAARPTQTLPPLEDWEQRRSVLGAVDEWRAGGRIGIVAGEDAQSGSLDWRQDTELVRVAIRGPLGAGGLRLEGDAAGLVLTAADGSRVVLTQPEQQLRDIYGWTIPVGSLSWWLRGLPDPGRPAVTDVGPEGWLLRLEQAGWTITYTDYRPAAGAMLPYRVRAETAGIRLTILLREWGFGRAAIR